MCHGVGYKDATVHQRWPPLCCWRLLITFFNVKNIQTNWWMTIPAIGIWCRSFLKPWQLSAVPHWAMPNGLWELLQAVGAMQFGIKFSASRKQSRRDVPQHSKVLIEFKSKWFIASFFIFLQLIPRLGAFHAKSAVFAWSGCSQRWSCCKRQAVDCRLDQRMWSLIFCEC